MSKRIAPALNDGQPDLQDAGPWGELLTTKEAAQVLGVSERSIRSSIQRRELAAHKRDRRCVITHQALDHFRLQRGLLGPNPSRGLLSLVPPPVEPASLVPFPSGRRSRLALLPAPLIRFIGREREMATVATLLRREDVRLVTLTGPGGVGKTRLALQVAADLAPVFADGAAFVPLAPVRSPDLVPASIAMALGVRDGEEMPALERLVHFLRPHRGRCHHPPS